MSAISLKSITGITSITTPTGVDNQLTLHTNDTTQRVKVTQSGIEVVGVATFQDIDVDGHTNLDNVSIAGVTTFTDTSEVHIAGGKIVKSGVSVSIAGTHVSLVNATNTAFMLQAVQGSWTKLFFNSYEKLVTSNTGISVTGSVVATGADINGDLDVDGHTNLDNVSIAGVSTFTGDSTGTEQVKIESSGGGTGIFIGNFQGIDAGDASGRLGVGKNDNALIFTNASGSPISNFAIGNTDSIPLVFSTHNKKRFEITGPGIAIFYDNQGTYTNTVQSHAGEGGFITHYTARTTSGADLYRRMLDIASGGANPHGSSIRFLTSDDNTNPATCVERMRILNNGGVYIGAKTHNQRYPHAQAPGLLTVQDGARVSTTSNVFAAPKGGFCDHARYDLESQLVSFSNSNLGIVQARNGQPLTINEGRTSWSHYNNLPNYLLGHAATDNINNTNFTLTLYADMTVFLLRENGWNSVDLTGWNLIEQDTNIGPAGSNTRLYVKSMAAGSYTNFDNDSAMYFFVL